METVMGMDMTIREIKTANTANFIMLAIILLILCVFVVVLFVMGAKIARKDLPITPIVDAVELERLTSTQPVNAFNLSTTDKTMVFDLKGARTYFAEKSSSLGGYPEQLDAVDLTKDDVLPANVTEIRSFLDNLSSGLMYVIREQYAVPETARYSVSASWRKKNVLRVLTIAERLLLQVAAMDKTTFLANPYNWTLRALKFLEVCALYLLSAEPVKYQLVANDLIPKILLDCEHLSRDQETPILMSVPMALMALLPWMLSKLYKSEPYNKIVMDEHYNAVLRRRELLPVTDLQNGNGRRYDQSYVLNKTVRFDRIALLTNDMAKAHFDNDLIIKAYNLKLPFPYLREIQSVYHHPKIEIRTPGLFGLQKRLNGGTTIATAPFGIRVIPSISYLRYYTPKYAFAVRAPKTGQAKFIRNIIAEGTSAPELRTMSTRSSYYWDHYRGILSADSTAEQFRFKFPEYGFVAEDSTTELLRDSLVPGTFSTDIDSMQTFEVLLADDTEFSFVLAAKQFGVFYYEHAALMLPKVRVQEFIVCDSEMQTIVHTIRVVPPSDSAEDATIVFYGVDGQTNLSVYTSKLKKYTITGTTAKKFQTTVNLKTQTIDTKEITDAAFEWPTTLNAETMLHVDQNANVAYINENNGKKNVKVLVATNIKLPKNSERALVVNNVNNGSTANDDDTSIGSTSKRQTLILNPSDSYQYSTNADVA